MLTVKGIYQDGKISLQQHVRYPAPIQVIVVFLDDLEPIEPKKQVRKTFSFRQSRELLKTYKGSLSDAVIEERRQAL